MLWIIIVLLVLILVTTDEDRAIIGKILIMIGAWILLLAPWPIIIGVGWLELKWMKLI